MPHSRLDYCERIHHDRSSHRWVTSRYQYFHELVPLTRLSLIVFLQVEYYSALSHAFLRGWHQDLLWDRVYEYTVRENNDMASITTSPLDYSHYRDILVAKISLNASLLSTFMAWDLFRLYTSCRFQSKTLKSSQVRYFWILSKHECLRIPSIVLQLPVRNA